MQYLFAKTPTYKWSFFAGLCIFYPFAYSLALMSDDHVWLAFVVLPPVAALVCVSSGAGVMLAVLSIAFYLAAAIRAEEVELRSALLFHIPIALLLFVFGMLYRRRKTVETSIHEESLSELQEELTLIREQYKTDLVANISNQKKFQKYSLLNRVSRVFGSQLQMDKLVEVVVQEVQEIIGPERGSFILALQPKAEDDAIVKSLPENRHLEHVLDDQYASWTSQHQSALLVADTTKDFRFQAQGQDTLVRSLMVAPLLSDGIVKGFLRSESPWANIFTSDDLRLITIMADLASVAAENAVLYQRAQELAITDGLTGLYLRRFFVQRFEEEMGRFHEHGTPFSLMILDLDHFKRINDQRGHLAGDQVLVQLSKLLQDEIRSIDILCRFGGEEFALLLPNTHVEGALVMAERIRKRIESTPMQVINDKINISISIGIGECPRHADDMTNMIKITDAALYRAKRNGRNQVMLAGGKV